MKNKQEKVLEMLFGVTLENAPIIRKNVFEQIHTIVFHGKGGYDWNTVYNIPIWLRKFTIKEMNEWYEKEKKAHEGDKGDSKTVVDSDGKINMPSFLKGKSSYK